MHSIVSFSVLGLVFALIVDADGAILAASVSGEPVALAAFILVREEAARDAAAIVVEGVDPDAIVVEAEIVEV